MKRHEESALQIARFLESHDKVAWVLYPGLPSHPQHDLAKTRVSGFSGMIAFELNGGVEAGRQLMNNVRLCGLAESLGSVETMITHPATMTHADVPAEDRRKRGLGDGLVRLSVGIEDVEDIIQDLEQGLTQA
jgi:methionine-gamma-lyase